MQLLASLFIIGLALVVPYYSTQAATIDLNELAPITASDVTNTTYSIAQAGDVNGDGYGDMVIGSPEAGSNNQGSVYLVYGQATRFEDYDLADAIEFQGDSAGDALGTVVAGLGDLNNDGYDDFGMVAPNYDSSLSNSGGVYLVYGQSAAFVTQSVTTLPVLSGLEKNEKLGAALAGVGDINNDGYADALIGSPYRDHDTGGAYVLYGKASAIASDNVSDLVLFKGQENDDMAGFAVAGNGDINGDGMSDAVLSAPKRDTSARKAGVVYVILGKSSKYSTQNLSNRPMLKGDTAFEHIGDSLSVAGDINNDGYNDVLIGAADNEQAATKAGAVYVWYGTSSVDDTTNLSTAIRLYGETAQAAAGVSLAYSGDVNEDEYSDFVVGSAGKVFLVYGSSTTYVSQPLSNFDEISNASDTTVGTAVAAAGDINNDGRTDTLFAGTTAVYLAHWPILTCANSADEGGILADYIGNNWRTRSYDANDHYAVVIPKTGRKAKIVNCKTDETVQTLTFNESVDRKIAFRLFEAYDKPVMVFATKTSSRKKLKIFFYQQKSVGANLTAATRLRWKKSKFKLIPGTNEFTVHRKQHEVKYVIAEDFSLTKKQ